MFSVASVLLFLSPFDLRPSEALPGWQHLDHPAVPPDRYLFTRPAVCFEGFGDSNIDPSIDAFGEIGFVLCLHLVDFSILRQIPSSCNTIFPPNIDSATGLFFVPELSNRYQLSASGR